MTKTRTLAASALCAFTVFAVPCLSYAAPPAAGHATPAAAPAPTPAPPAAEAKPEAGARPSSESRPAAPDSTKEAVGTDDASVARNAARTRMRECGHQWSTMKKSGAASGLTWKDFSMSCLARR